MIFIVSSSAPDREQDVEQKDDENKEENHHIAWLEHGGKSSHHFREIDGIRSDADSAAKVCQVRTAAVRPRLVGQITDLKTHKRN